MTFEEFIEQYKPITNPNGAFGEFMFETYEQDYAEVLKHVDEHKVWTIIDEGELYLVPGLWRVNRLGYMISEVPYEDDKLIINLDE